MTIIPIRLVDHLTSTGEARFVIYEGVRVCLTGCTYLDPIGRCRLFDATLAFLTTYPRKPEGTEDLGAYKSCKPCCTLMRQEFGNAVENPSVTIVVQRNLEGPRIELGQGRRLKNYEVEMNTILRGYNEFRLTMTQVDPYERNGTGVARPDELLPSLVAPIVLDPDEPGESDE